MKFNKGLFDFIGYMSFFQSRWYGSCWGLKGKSGSTV